MSVELMSLVMKADLGTVAYFIPATDKRPEAKGYLGHADKSVLLALADRGHEDGLSIFPSVEWMSKTAGVSERTAQRSLLHLKNTFPRILAVEKKANRYSPTRYRIMVSALERVARWKLEKAGVTTSPAGVTRRHPSAFRGDTVSRRGDTVTPEPLVEPSQSKANHQLQQPPQTESTSKAIAAEKPAASALSKRFIFDDPKHQATADRVDASFRDSGSSRARAVMDSRAAALLAAYPDEE